MALLGSSGSLLALTFPGVWHRGVFHPPLTCVKQPRIADETVPAGVLVLSSLLDSNEPFCQQSRLGGSV